MKLNAATVAALTVFFSASSCAPIQSSEVVAPVQVVGSASDPLIGADAPLGKRNKVLSGSNDGPIPRWKYTTEYEAEKRSEDDFDKRDKVLSGNNDGAIPRWKHTTESEFEKRDKVLRYVFPDAYMPSRCPCAFCKKFFFLKPERFTGSGNANSNV